jgi:hypothetical protein
VYADFAFVICVFGGKVAGIMEIQIRRQYLDSKGIDLAGAVLWNMAITEIFAHG